ncbi:MAG: hypothetical protein ABIQ86_09710 [Steroidobacteraceae bacterium]
MREGLLQKGIAPRHVNRYVAELHDHMADLVARECASGLDMREAQAKARAILGTDAQLVRAVIDRGVPRSLAAKAPWAVFGILPVTVMIVLFMLLAFGSMSFFLPYRALSGAAIPEYVRAVGTTITIVGSYAIGPLLAAACIAIALRQRLSSGWVWAGLAFIALASGPFGVHINFVQPAGGMTGGIRGSVIQTVYEQGRIDLGTTLVTIAVRIVVLFALSALAYRFLKQRAEELPHASA